MADAREGIAKGLEGKLDEAQIKLLMDEVLAINKNVYADFTCKGCGKRQRQQALVPDAKAVTSALGELMNQSWGRPGDSKVETEIIVNRNVYLVAEEDESGDDQLDISG